VDLIKKLPEVFPPDDDIGPLKKIVGPPMKIQLRKGAVPVKKFKAAPIPFNWQEKVKAQLDAMVAKDIAEKVPVGEVPDWISPRVSMKIVDAFSRFPVGKPIADNLEGEENVEDYAKKVVVNCVIRDKRVEEMKIETTRELNMIKLVETIHTGFPEHRAQLDEDL